MIFVTVGEQLPFDRLLRIIDSCALEMGQKIFAQIGDSMWQSENFEYKKFLNPDEFNEKFDQADLIIAHAGMGTIITALEKGKPIIVLPRKSSLGEHRNDHQFATAQRFLRLDYISVAFDDEELKEMLNTLENIEMQKKKTRINVSSADLMKTIKKFVASC